MAQGLDAAFRHHLDRQTAIEIGNVLPVLELSLGTVEQGLDERVVLGLVHRAVDVGGGVASGAFLVVAGLAPGLRHIHAIEVNDGGDGVEEGQGVLAGAFQDGGGQGRRGEGAGGDHHIVPFSRGKTYNLLARDGDQGMRLDGGSHALRKPIPVHRQRAARRHLAGVGRAQNERAAATHFRMQQAHRIVFPVVRAEGVGANQFGQPVRMVGVGAAHRAHLVQ